MNRFYYLLVVLFLPIIGVNIISAQTTQSPPAGEFFQILAKKNAYFDSLKQFFPDSIFYHEGSEYNRYQRWIRFWEPRIGQNGDFNTYQNAITAYYSNFSAPLPKKTTNLDAWNEIGTPQLNDCGIGPIHFMDVYEPNNQHMLAGSHKSGLFFTEDGGDTWSNTGTDTELERSYIHYATFHPSNPNIWFAVAKNPHFVENVRGTNLAYNSPVSDIGGIKRKGGSSPVWETVLNGISFSNPDIAIGKIMFNPVLNSNLDYDLFISTNGGLWVCNNPSSTTPIINNVSINIPASIPASNPLFTFDPDEITIYDLEILPTTSGISRMYASVSFYGQDMSGNSKNEWRVLESFDNGQTWSEVPGQTAGYDPDIKYIGIEVSKADENKVWTLIQILRPGQGTYTTGSAIPGHIKVYDQISLNWTTLIPNSVNETFGGGHAFAIDQVQGRYIIHGNGNSEYNNCLANAAGLRVFDTQISAYLPSSLIDQGAIHGDMRDFYFSTDPTGQENVWVCNDGGINVSYNLGEVWDDKSNGLGIANVEAIASSYESSDYMLQSLFHVGTYWSNTPYNSTSWDPIWSITDGGDGTQCMIYKNDPNFMYVSHQNGAWKKTEVGTTTNSFSNNNVASQWRSEGDLNQFKKGYIYRTGKTDLDVPNNGNYKIAVIRSIDNGVTNEAISSFQTDFPQHFSDPSSVAYIHFIKANPYNENEIVVNLRTDYWNYILLRTKNVNEPNPNNVIWEELPVPRATYGGFIAGLDFDPNNSNLLYLAYSNSGSPNPSCPANSDLMIARLDYSDPSLYPFGNFCGFECDGTYPCFDLSMNLPNTFAGINSLFYEKGSDGGLYFATDFGVYYTNNKRISNFDSNNEEDPDDQSNQSGWVRLGSELPHIEASDLEPNYSVNMVRIGLNGRGIWEHPFQCPEDYDLIFSQIGQTSYFHEAENDIISEAFIVSNENVTYRAGNKVQLMPGFKTTGNTKFHGFIHACNHPGNSFKKKNSEGSGNEEDILQTIDRKEALEPSNDLLIYPNPARNNINVKLLNFVDSNHRIIIYNSTGQIVLNKQYSKSEYIIDLKNYKNGIYIMRIFEQSGNVYSTKFIKN